MPISGIYVDPNVRTPYIQQYNTNVQWEFAKNYLLEVGYVGSKGTKLLQVITLNQPGYNPATNSFTAPFGTVLSTQKNTAGGIQQVQSTSLSHYNSLQVSVTKRFSQGLQFLAAYTLGRSTDFYSGAAIPRGTYVLWMLAGVDGQVHEADGINDQAIPRLGWGSDLASVKTTCGSGIQVLAASNGDGTTADYVRAYEVADREPVPVSQPVELNGPVTALWSETAGTGAVVITRNLQTGKYEAVRLAITCGQ